jgi:hypothetical protein
LEKVTCAFGGKEEDIAMETGEYMMIQQIDREKKMQRERQKDRKIERQKDRKPKRK